MSKRGPVREVQCELTKEARATDAELNMDATTSVFASRRKALFPGGAPPGPTLSELVSQMRDNGAEDSSGS